MKVVLDTNVILSSIALNSRYHSVISALINNGYSLFITNEILMEYTEKLEEKFSVEISQTFFDGIENLNNVFFIDRIFESKLIENDPDDNKFIDCAYAGNVHFLVTNDKHFDRIKTIEFPKLNIITIDEFVEILNS